VSQAKNTDSSRSMTMTKTLSRRMNRTEPLTTRNVYRETYINEHIWNDLGREKRIIWKKEGVRLQTVII